MKLIIKETYQELSETIASITLGEFYIDKRVNIDLTDGSAPQGAYDIMIPIMKKNPEQFKNVHIYNHDEAEQEGFVYSILKKQIHDPMGFQDENIHRMYYKTFQEYPTQIENDGGLDYMLLGLGADGHFCCNFPFSTKFDKIIYDFDPSEYPWYEEYCKAFKVEAMPKLATLGFMSLLKTKRVVIVASGLKKAEAIRDILTKPVSESIPGTILRTHPNITFVIDKEAASLYEKELEAGFKEK